MGTAVLELQDALYSVLVNDTTLQQSGCAIYDEVPENAPFPFLLLSDGMETPLDMFSEMGRLSIFNVHVWSQAKGTSEMEMIFDRVDALFHHNPDLPVMPTYDLVYGQRDTISTMRDADGLTRHLVARYVFYVEVRL